VGGGDGRLGVRRHGRPGYGAEDRQADRPADLRAPRPPVDRRQGDRTRRQRRAFADMLYTPATEASDHDIIDAVGLIGAPFGASVPTEIP
jgi:hypothetical protein